VVARAKEANSPFTPPSVARSILRGMIGFTVVSIAGFLPWAAVGKWDHRHPSEFVVYPACAAVFVVLSGILLHRLIIGPGSLWRFYLLFGTAFAMYSVAWMAGWMCLHGYPVALRSVVGVAAATVVMGLILCSAFGAWEQVLKVILALFVLNSAGYFAGDRIEACMVPLRDHVVAGMAISIATMMVLMKLIWGACFGVGLGAGLGLAFHLCQVRTAALMRRVTDA
jgi:hypothetical protein